MQSHHWVGSTDGTKIAAGLKYSLLVELNPDDDGLMYVASVWDAQAVAEAGDDALPEASKDFASMAAAEYWCEAIDLQEASHEAFRLADQIEEVELDKQRMADWEASL